MRKSTTSAKGVAGEVRAGDPVAFFASCEPGDGATAGWLGWEADLPGDIHSPSAILRLNFSTERIKRPQKPEPVVILHGRDAQGKATRFVACDSSQISNSGENDSVWVRLPEGFVPARIEVRLSPARTQSALRLFGMAFGSMEDARLLALGSAAPAKADDSIIARLFSFLRSHGVGSKDATKSALVPLILPNPRQASLEAIFDQHLAKPGDSVLDGAGRFAGESFEVDGVPFVVPGDEKNLIAPPVPLESPKDEVMAMGVKLPRAKFFPPSRESPIEIEVGRPVSEVYLLLVADMPRVVGRYALPSVPLRLFDINWFAVELVYADGTRDLAFPYSLAAGGFAISGMTGAYAVPADPARSLSAVRVLNRDYNSTIYVAAVTLNTSPIQRLASVWSPVSLPSAAPMGPAKPEAPFVKESENGVTLGNDAFSISLDLSDGFAFSKISRPSAAAVSLSPDSGLRCRVAGKTLSGRDFKITSKEINGNAIILRLVPKDGTIAVGITLTLSATEEPGVVLDATVETSGDKPLPVELTLPLLQGIHFGKPADAWLFFPQYRNVLTSAQGSFLASNNCKFTVQFLTAFDPASTLAVSLLTENTTAEAFDYLAAKTDAGCALGVRHPSTSLILKPGEPAAFSPVRILVHNGGWKEAMRRYKSWAERTFPPHRATDRQWFLDTWLVNNIHVDPKYAKQITSLPPLMEEGGSFRFRTSEFLDLTESFLGRRPDMIHLGSWFHDFSGKEVTPLHGDYVEPYIFAQLGGIEKFRQNIRELRDVHKTRGSIYTISDRVSTKAKTAEQGRRFPKRDSKGTAIIAGDQMILNMEDPACQAWQTGMLISLQQQTGVDAVYLDVFPTPGNKASLEFIRTMRDGLPPQTVLWCEYPAPDYTGACLDGCIVYHYLTLPEHFTGQDDRLEKAPLEAPMCLSISRFTDPGIKNIFFPVGYGSGGGFSSDLKQAFFMGDAIYNVGYLLFPERIRTFQKQALRVLAENQDCFTSLHPEPLIETLMPGIRANAFPGNGRTAYTFLNASFITRRGEMLAVPHIDGTRYTDAFTGREITPRIRNGKAMLPLSIAPQDAACIIATPPRD